VTDYRAQLEKLRRDAAECALIRDLATDKAKREMFDRLANHLTVLADQVEMAMIERKSDANAG
jgi:ribosomal protein S7